MESLWMLSCLQAFFFSKKYKHKDKNRQLLQKNERYQTVGIISTLKLCLFLSSNMFELDTLNTPQKMRQNKIGVTMKRISIQIILMLIFWSTLSAQEDTAFTSTISHRRGSLGVGYGLCYGGFGFNGDFNLSDELALSGSIGTFKYVGGYELGIKYFFGDFDWSLRPKLSTWYGVNAIVHANPSINSGLPKLTEAHKGFCVGAGGEWMFGAKKKNGLDFDLLYIAYTTQTKRLKELESQGYSKFSRGSPILVSLGYRYTF